MGMLVGDGRVLLPIEIRTMYAEFIDARAALLGAVGGGVIADLLGIVRAIPGPDFAARLGKYDGLRRQLRAAMLEFIGEEFPGIGIQTTGPVLLVTRVGLVELERNNAIPAVAAALADPADRLTFATWTAYRAGRMSVADAMKWLMLKAAEQAARAERSEARRQYDRQRNQLLVQRDLEESIARLRRVGEALDRAGIVDVSLHLVSGTGTRFRARFPSRTGQKWSSTEFTLPAPRLLALSPEVKLEKAPGRDRPRKNVFIFAVDRLQMFVPPEAGERALAAIAGI